MRISHVEEFDNPLPVGKWECSMMRCPSQCYYRTQRNGVDYVLYLRWRWDDPWRAHIVKNADSERATSRADSEWSSDVFKQHGLHFEHDDVVEAQMKLLELFQEDNA